MEDIEKPDIFADGMPLTEEGASASVGDLWVEEQDKEEEKEFGVLDSMAEGRKTWIDQAIRDGMDLGQFDEQPKIEWTGELVSDLTDGLYDSYSEFVLEADSLAEANYRREIALQKQDTMEQLSKGGMSNVVAMALTSALDPTEIAAVTAATWGLGTVPSRLLAFGKAIDSGADAIAVGKKVYGSVEQARDAARVKKSMGVGAAEAMATAAPFEYYKSEVQADYGDEDFWTVMTLAGGLGATFKGGAAYFNNLKRFDAYNRRTAAGQPPLTDVEKEYFKDIIEDRAFTKMEAKLDAVEGVPAKGEKVDSNAMAFENRANFDDAPKMLGTNGVLTFGLRKHLSSIARAKSSDSGFIRTLGGRLGLNSAGNSDGSAVDFDALTLQNWFQQSSTARVIPTWQKAAKQWRKANGQSAYSPLKNMEQDMEYFIEVAKAVRRGGSKDPHIQAGVDAWVKEQKYFLEQAQKGKVKGAEELAFDASYLPRINDDVRWDVLVRKYGEDDVAELYEGAIKAKQPDLDPEIAKAISKGYVRGVMDRIKMRIIQHEPMNYTGIYEDGLAEIRAGLKSMYSDAEVDDIMARIEEAYGIQHNTKDGKISRMKKRVDLDETFVHTTKSGDTIAIEDFLNNNLSELHGMYTYQMGGAIGLARNGINREGMESFDYTINKLRNDIEGLTGDQVKARMKEVDALEFMYDGITGRLAHQTGMSEKTEDMLRRVREFNFIRSMGASGIPTFVESAAVLFEHQAKTLWQTLPRMRKLITKAADGNLEDPLMRELMHATGVGIDMFTGRVRTHFDDIESDLLRSRYTKTDAILAKGRQTTAIASGMLPLTAMFRRMDTLYFAQDWFNAARKGKAPYASIKMQQLGIEPEDAQLIQGMIKKHAVTDKKGRLVHMNLDKWKTDGADGERAYDIFSASAYRHSTQSVQETNISSVNRFLRSPWGKTVGQFLSYVLAAQEQQFQRHYARLFHGDALTSFRTLMAGSFVSTLAYTAGVHYRSTGMSEERRKKYLKERLAPDRLFTDGAIGYLGAFSFQSTILQRTREANLINNPSFDLVRLMVDASGMLKDAATTDKELSESQVARMLGVLPTSWYGLGVAKNALADELTD